MELVINFSGGKDSTAMLAYLRETYPDVKMHVVFADTGWEHPDAEDWSRQIVARFGLELQVVRSRTKTFLSMVEARGMFPGMSLRQCTSDLKRDPIMRWIRNNVKDPVVVNCMGIRSEESSNRKKQKALKRDGRESNTVRTVWDWKPIKKWTEAEVLKYLADRDLPVHPVYKYLRRFSCRVCIFMTQHDLEQVKKHDPEAIQVIAQLERRINFSMKPEGFLDELLTV